MARIELEITGNATGLEQAAKKASAATNGLTKATGMSREEIAKWDAAARRNQMEMYDRNLKRTTTSTRQQATETAKATVEVNKSTNSLIRHTYAQRAALSASNNLARSFAAVSAGGRGVASSAGIAVRQLATLSTAGIGATGGMSALAGAFLGGGGLIIALSAAVSAITSYIAKQNEASKSTDGTTKAVADQGAVLSRALGEGAYVEAVKNIEQLRINVDLARKGIVKKTDVVNEYNRTLGDTAGRVNSLNEVEKFLVDKSDAYIKAMLFRSAANLAVEDAAKKAYEAQLELSKPIPAPNIPMGFIGQDGQQIANEVDTYLSMVSKKRKDGIKDLKKDQDRFLEISRGFFRESAEIANEFGFNLFETPKNKTNPAENAATKLADLLARSGGATDASGLKGFDAITEKTRQNYEKMYSDISQLEKKIVSDKRISESEKTKLLQEAAKTRNQLIVNEANENLRNEEEYAKKTSDAIQGIYDKAGISRITSLSQELQRDKAYFDKLSREYSHEAEVLLAIEEARESSRNNIIEKWNQKNLDSFNKVYDKINTTLDKSFTRNINGEAKISKKIQEDLKKRLALIDKYFDEIQKLNKGNVLALGLVEALRIGSRNRITEAAEQADSSRTWDDFVDDLDKQLRRSVQHFGRDFLRTLSTINQQANVTFGGIVSTLVGSLTGGITEVFSTMFSQQLSGIVKSSFKDMGKTMSNIVAGVGIAGTVVSGAFKPTSVGGQALGGALSGAGAGLAVGGPIGAVIGGAIGAITGALGAASAKRIQEEQLAEQRKQTALLERQNALAYASQIMGQMTAGGAVTGIMRDAFGQLVATVKGSDLQFVLQRSGGQR